MSLLKEIINKDNPKKQNKYQKEWPFVKENHIVKEKYPFRKNLISEKLK